MKSTVIWAFCLLFFLKVNAQDDMSDIVKRIDVVEPTAASLGKFGEYPVSYSTGLPNIVIPLYTIKSGDLEVPIELRYHGGGIKASEEASWVGLGWDLFYGGMISRQVNGLPDELESFDKVPLVADVEQYMRNHPQEFSGYLKQLSEAKTAGYSFMQDLYYFDVNGNSGQFIYDNTNTIVAIPFSDYKINFSGSTSTMNPNSVVLPNGTKYEFASNDQTQLLPAPLAYSEYTSTWHINKIVSANGIDEIVYTYQVDGSITNKLFAYSCGFSRSGVSCDFNSVPYGSPSYLGLTTSPKMQRVTSKKPNTILFKNGRIRFELASREDIYSDQPSSTPPLKKLQNIYVEKKCSDGSFQTLYRFEFKYSYFQNGTLVSPNSSKLKLEKVLKYSNSPTDFIPLAEFVYEEPANIPLKNTYSVDYWGFYNGKNNSTPIPSLYLAAGNLLYKYGGANKEPDSVMMKIGTLKEIKYPTQGKTTFDWGINHYGATKPVVDYESKASISVALNYNADFNHGSIINPENGVPYEYTYNQENFSVKVPQYVKLSYRLYYHNISNDHNKYDEATISLSNGSNVVFSRSIISISYNLLEQVVYLPAGEYVVSIQRNCGNIVGLIEFYYNAYDPSKESGNYQIGGLRINSIYNYDSDNRLIDTKKFTYINPVTGKSSGVLTNTTKKTFTSRRKAVEYRSISTYGCQNAYTETVKGFSDALSGIYSNTVQYQFVQVYQIDRSGNDNGYTEYEYSVMADDEINDQIEPISNFWKRGQLLRETMKRKDLSGYSTLREIINTYTVDSRINRPIRGFKMNSYFDVASFCPTCGDLTVSDVFVPYNYFYTLGWKHLDQSTETIYQSTANTVKIVNYYYDGFNYSFHNRLTTSDNYNSVESYTKYPLDYTTNTEITGSGDSETSKAISRMVAENIIALPVESYTMKNSNVVSARFNEYKTASKGVNLEKLYDLQLSEPVLKGNKFNSSQSDESDKFNPSNIWSAGSVYSDAKDGFYPETPDLSVSYNEYGLIAEYNKNNDYKTSIYWGYDHEYPLVKAEGIDIQTLSNAVNAVQNNMESFLLNTIKDLSTQEEKNSWKTFDSNLRNYLLIYRPLITTYTYSPLVGITSQTDPAGITVYYEYDSFGRLTYIRDNDGKLLKKYEYNYKQ